MEYASEMRLILACFFLLTVCGQEAPKAAAPKAGPGVRLVIESGFREKMPALLDANMETGKVSMRKQCEECSEEFVDEWARRMKTRMNVDELVDLAGGVYEKIFSAEELEQLIAGTAAMRAGRQAEVSEELKKKATEKLPAVIGAISGAFSEYGAKKGMEVATEIGKEHPEWTKKGKGQ